MENESQEEREKNNAELSAIKQTTNTLLKQLSNTTVPHFGGGLVLVCIEADFCKHILTLQDLFEI